MVDHGQVVVTGNLQEAERDRCSWIPVINDMNSLSDLVDEQVVVLEVDLSQVAQWSRRFKSDRILYFRRSRIHRLVVDVRVGNLACIIALLERQREHKDEEHSDQQR